MATQRPASVVIIGLGYVGLTLAVALARKGVRVYGVERRREVVDMVNEGRPHFSEIGLEAALTNVIESGRLTACHSTEGIPPAQYYIITVGTPLRPGTYEPDRKGVVAGKSVSVRVDLCGRRIIKKK